MAIFDDDAGDMRIISHAAIYILLGDYGRIRFYSLFLTKWAPCYCLRHFVCCPCVAIVSASLITDKRAPWHALYTAPRTINFRHGFLISGTFYGSYLLMKWCSPIAVSSSCCARDIFITSANAANLKIACAPYFIKALMKSYANYYYGSILSRFLWDSRRNALRQPWCFHFYSSLTNIARCFLLLASAVLISLLLRRFAIIRS